MIGIGIGLFIGGGGSHTGIRLSAATLPENSAEGTAVGTLSVVGGTGTYTFTLTDSAGTRFKVAGTNGVNLQAGATASNAEVAQSYNITVHADNGAGSTFDRTFPITISDVNEATPVITSNGGGSTATVSIAYNATAVTTVTATDADVSASIIYSISGGADAAKFTINSSTGVLALNSVQAAGDYVVIVQASDGTNTDTQTITVTVNAAPSAPVNTVAPAVTGTETEGETLTSTSGTWTGTATITYAYQWYQAVLDGSDNVVTDMSGVPLRDDPISAATSSTYVLQAGDVGEKIFCYVTATNGVGSASKASNATGLIAALPSYTGPGDIVSGASAWCGLRAYSIAAIGTNAVRLRRSSDDAELNFATLADGSLDVASIATWAGSDTLFVSVLYDQTGNLAHQVQNTPTSQPIFTLSAIGSRPAIDTSGRPASLSNQSAVTDDSQPFSISAVVKRVGSFTSQYAIFRNAVNVSGLFFADSADTVMMYAGSVQTATAVDNSLHALNAVFNGASSSLTVDGSSTSTNPGTQSSGTAVELMMGPDQVFGEAGRWPVAFSGPQTASMNSNQHTYWGF